MSSIQGRTVKYFLYSTQQPQRLARTNKNGDLRRRFIVQFYLNTGLVV